MDGSPDNPGVIPRAVEYIFTRLAKIISLSKLESDVSKDTKIYQYALTMAHLEIYNEKVYDLSNTKRLELDIRQDAGGNIVVANLNDEYIKDLQHFNRHYEQTKNNRFTASTLLNSCSSRSHSVLRITVFYSFSFVTYI